MQMKVKDGKPAIQFLSRELELANAFLTLLETIALVQPFNERAKKIQAEAKSLIQDVQGAAE